MIALISPAKNMLSDAPASESFFSQPRFLDNTRYIVELMIAYSAEELADIYKVSPAIARELKRRFVELYNSSESPFAALDCYDGVVYKHIKGDNAISLNGREYLQKHLRISSLLYGLLRPLDAIRPYRMEGFVRLAGSDERVDRYWRDVQTATLIEDVKSSGGELLYLASAEEKNAFDWAEVKRAVRVIEFKFMQHKGDKLRQVVVYTKMARGEMVRYMVENTITNPEELQLFEWGGYRYDESRSTDDEWTWVME